MIVLFVLTGMDLEDAKEYLGIIVSIAASFYGAEQCVPVRHPQISVAFVFPACKLVLVDALFPRDE